MSKTPINLIAPINTLGGGYLGFNFLKSASDLGHEVALWPLGHVEAETEHHPLIRRAIDRTALYPSTAPCLTIFQPLDLAMRVGRGIHAGLVVFELDRLTRRERHHVGQLDAVITPTRWAGGVLAANGIDPARIAIAPHGVDHSIFRPVEPSRGGPTVFLHVGKWEIRKGIPELCRAFDRAFEKADDVRLLLLTPNPLLRPEESRRWVNLFRESRLADKVIIHEARLPTHRDVARVMAGADCGVFPSRAEGWGLPIAELMAMGKHVITTNYSAMTEYCTPANSRLIEIDGLVEAFDGKFFFGEGRWAEMGERQVEQLVEHLRAVHRAKQAGELGLNRAGIETMARFSWGRMVNEIVGALA